MDQVGGQAARTVDTDMQDSRDRPSAHRRTGAQASATSPTLTRNETMVLGTLKSADAPLKAYELLAQLKTQGVKAPMTVYRALDRLEGRGLVHKLDGLGAFVVCNHDEPHAVQTFLVCDGCAGVSELSDTHEAAAVDERRLTRLATESGFTLQSARVEIRGRCGSCK